MYVFRKLMFLNLQNGNFSSGKYNQDFILYYWYEFLYVYCCDSQFDLIFGVKQFSRQNI